MKSFKKVYIEITNVCNLQCDFCPVTKREKQYITIDKFDYLLNQIKNHTNHIYFHIKGEPLLHPKLGELLDVADKYNLNVNITTNGTLLKHNIDKLIDKPALRQINISLHSEAGNEDKSFHKDYLNNIFDFINESRVNNKLILSLRLWNLNSENMNSNKYILEKIEKEFNLNFKIEDNIDPKKGIKLQERIYLNHDVEFIWPDLNNDDFGKYGYCQGLRDQIGILVDGTVIPCCLDGEGKINLGNIYEKNFEDILNSQRAKAIYDGFSNRIAVEELCRKCGFRTRFDL